LFVLVCVTPNKKKKGHISASGTEREKKVGETYDDVRFDEARDGVEDALGTVGLLLTPERKTLGKVFVAGSADFGWW
jgi:hypothetical protein